MLEYNHGFSSPLVPPGTGSASPAATSRCCGRCGTRWADNDMFGHLNNAVYYQLFDTAINAWINTSTGLDPLSHARAGHRRRVGLSLLLRTAFPARASWSGLAVTRLGRSSVTYRLGVFRPTRRRAAAADHRAGALGARLCRSDQPQAGPDSRRHPLTAVDGLRRILSHRRACASVHPAMLRQCQF